MARPKDLEDFYSTDIGRTVKLTLTSAAATFQPDSEGPLKPGRYLVQLLGGTNGAATGRAWIKFIPFVAGDSPSIAVGSGLPLDPAGRVHAEINIRSGYNDRVVGIMAVGLGDSVLYLTRISASAVGEPRV